MEEGEALVDHLQRLYARWHASRGASVHEWLALVADDVRLSSTAHGIPGVEFTRAGAGRQAVLRYLTGLREGWEMVFYEAEEFVAQRDRIVMLGRCSFRNRPTGKAMETDKVDVFRIREGKIVEFAEFYDSAALMSATIPD